LQHEDWAAIYSSGRALPLTLILIPDRGGVNCKFEIGGKFVKFSEQVGSRTRDLPACSVPPRPSAREPFHNEELLATCHCDDQVEIGTREFWRNEDIKEKG
jgi:hypothetical protein